MYQKSANKSRYIVRYSLNVQHIYMYKIEKKIYSKRKYKI